MCLREFQKAFNSLVIINKENDRLHFREGDLFAEIRMTCLIDRHLLRLTHIIYYDKNCILTEIAGPEFHLILSLTNDVTLLRFIFLM